MSIGKTANVPDSTGFVLTGLYNNSNNSAYPLANFDKDVCKIKTLCFHVLPRGALKPRSAFFCLSNTSNPQVATTYISVFKTLEGNKVFVNLLYVENSIVQFESKTLLYLTNEPYRWKKIEVDFTTLVLKVSLSEEDELAQNDQCVEIGAPLFYDSVSSYFVCLVNDKDIGVSELTDFYMSEVSF